MLEDGEGEIEANGFWGLGAVGAVMLGALEALDCGFWVKVAMEQKRRWLCCLII